MSDIRGPMKLMSPMTELVSQSVSEIRGLVKLFG
jgi:hypothetical protein